MVGTVWSDKEGGRTRNALSLGNLDKEESSTGCKALRQNEPMV